MTCAATTLRRLRAWGDDAVSAAHLGVGAATTIPADFVRQARHLVREFDLRDTDVTPTALPVLALEALAERAVLIAYQLSLVDHPPATIEKIAHEVAAFDDYLGERGWLDHPVEYFEEPPPLVDPDVRHDRVGRLDIERVEFDSGYLPALGEPGRQRWTSYVHNERAHAWVVRDLEADGRALDRDARPWLILHHGASMGWALMDLAVFRAAWLHHDLGLNLVFPVLPFHGPRRARTPLSLQLPVDDPVDTVHTFAQSVWDTRRLIGWIRRQSDAPIGVHGISLGAHSAALTAAVVDDLAGVIVGVPAASISDLYVEHLPGRLRTRRVRDLVERSRDVLSVVSPLSVEPLVPVERRFIYAARSDRITDAAAQAQRLWEHWDRPASLWVESGHLSVAWSSQVAGFIEGALASCDLVAS